MVLAAKQKRMNYIMSAKPAESQYIVKSEVLLANSLQKTNRRLIRSYGNIVQSPPYEAIPAQNSSVTSSNLRRQDRHSRSGGMLFKVSSTSGGYMSGIAGNTKPLVAGTIAAHSEEALEVPDSSGHTSKTDFGETAMTALTLGAYAPTMGLKPTTKAKKPSTLHTTASKKLTFTQSRTGLIAYQKGTPVAWIAQGYHRGQLDKRPHTCTFIDVVYHRQTQHGINLESADFDTLEQAKAFVCKVFGGAV